jgi:hypothetical protein
MGFFESFLPCLASPDENTAIQARRLWWCGHHATAVLNDRPSCKECGSPCPSDRSGSSSIINLGNTTSADKGATSNKTSGKLNGRITHSSHPYQGQSREADHPRGIYELTGETPGDGRLASLESLASLGRVATSLRLEDIANDLESGRIRGQQDALYHPDEQPVISQSQEQNITPVVDEELVVPPTSEQDINPRNSGQPLAAEQKHQARTIIPRIIEPRQAQTQGQGIPPLAQRKADGGRRGKHYMTRQVNGHLAVPRPIYPCEDYRPEDHEQVPHALAQNPLRRPGSPAPIPAPENGHSGESNAHPVAGGQGRHGHYAIDFDDAYELDSFYEAWFDPNEYAWPLDGTQDPDPALEDVFPRLQQTRTMDSRGMSPTPGMLRKPAPKSAFLSPSRY